MRNFFRHILLWVIALSILNTSIDIAEYPALGSNSTANATDHYDEIESIAELLLDETTNQTLPDQKNDDQQGVLKKSASFDFSIPEKKERHLSPFIGNFLGKLDSQNQADALPQVFEAIETPPPDLV